jgi:hypothetical protein
LFGDGVNLWPVGEEFHGGQEISDSPVALKEMYSDVKCDHFERCVDVVLVHQALRLVLGPGLAAQVSHFLHRLSLSPLRCSR